MPGFGRGQELPQRLLRHLRDRHPVLFLAIVVQGGAYEAMLRTARAGAQNLPKRERDYAAAELLPPIAYLALAMGLLGEIAALLALYNGSEAGSVRTFVLVAMVILLGIVAAGPAWKWWQASHAIDRQRLRPAIPSPEDPAYGYGGSGRPLWTVRDMDAERIRIALRDAGCRELGKREDGFVVEGGHGREPFYVACPGVSTHPSLRTDRRIMPSTARRAADSSKVSRR